MIDVLIVKESQLPCSLITAALKWVLIIIGVVPLAAGLFDRCVFAPLFGLPFLGWRLRRSLENKQHA
jgi:hypothetical protein